MVFNFELTEIILFGLIFAILGFFLIFLHIPKDEKFRYYRQARKILGTAFIIMTFYCILKSIIPVKGYEYTHRCLLILFSLIFSWLNYYTFLTLIYAKRSIRKRFFLDDYVCFDWIQASKVPTCQRYHLQRYLRIKDSMDGIYML